MVRELDEENKGEYVSYVDEGTESYDAAMKINMKGDVVSASCDCETKTDWCLHKIALLSHIASNKKVKSPVKIKRKLKPYEALMLDIDFAELKSWVAELLENNKDLALEFAAKFAAKASSYTIDDIKKINTEAVKSIVKARKKIETSELKKIVDLWKKMHEPIMEYFSSNLYDEAAIKTFHLFLEDCLETDSKFKINSTKISAYLQDIIKLFTLKLNMIEDGLQYQKYIETHMEFSTVHRFYTIYIPIIFLNQLFDSASALQQKTIMAIAFKAYQTFAQLSHNAKEHFLKAIFKMAVASNTFEKYIDKFEPIRFDNEYNLSIIDQLIALNRMEKAKQYCREQIRANYDVAYSIPYYERLRKIYKIEGHLDEEINIARMTIEFTFNFEDYKLILQSMNNIEDAKKFRNRLYARSQNYSRSADSSAALSFGFKLLHFEGKIEKMLEKIDGNTPCVFVVNYFDIFFKKNQETLLEKILKMKIDNYYMDKQGLIENSQNAALIIDLVLENYDCAFLQRQIIAEKKNWGYYNMPFQTMLEKRLQDLIKK